MYWSDTIILAMMKPGQPGATNFFFRKGQFVLAQVVPQVCSLEELHDEVQILAILEGSLQIYDESEF
jgi:hypothetical protein